MRSSVKAIHQLVAQIDPWDDLEHRRREQALRWLESTDDVYRRARPDIPSPHLVSYVALVDEAGAVLLVDHVAAGLWLPAGGHVEPDEHPAAAARRELAEELGADRPFLDGPTPAFITATRTTGPGSHIDVSLWFRFGGSRSSALDHDRREMRGTRWWTVAEAAAERAGTFDPHFGRFLAKTSPP